MRSRVDLPEPDNPMTTKICPGSTVNEASITAAVVPSARNSSRSEPLSSFRTASSGRLPNTLYKCSACSLDTYTSRVEPKNGLPPPPADRGAMRIPSAWHMH